MKGLQERGRLPSGILIDDRDLAHVGNIDGGRGVYRVHLSRIDYGQPAASITHQEISAAPIGPDCVDGSVNAWQTEAPGTQFVVRMRAMRRGILLALASAVLFGASTPFAKALLGSVDPWLMAGLLYIGAGLGLAVLHVSRRALRLPAVEAPLRRPDLSWLAVVILFGGVLGPLLLMLGLARTSAAATSLLLNLEGLATMGIAWVVYHENVDRRLLLGAFAILAGAVLLSWRGAASFRWSELLIAGACLCWGIDNNLTRKLSSSDPVEIAMLKGLVAGAVNLGLALNHGATLPSARTVAAAGLVGFLGYGVSLALFVLGLRHLGTARTGAYFSLAPFVGAVLAVAMLGEPLSAQLVIAGGLMGFGLWLHIAERHEHEHLHEPMEHEHRHRHDEHHQHGHAATDPPGEPHTHQHRHVRLVHRHPHYPDLHHRHGH
jgi:drug/metabolite transporter (DMT)-like permease